MLHRSLIHGFGRTLLRAGQAPHATTTSNRISSYDSLMGSASLQLQACTGTRASILLPPSPLFGSRSLKEPVRKTNRGVGETEDAEKTGESMSDAGNTVEGTVEGRSWGPQGGTKEESQEDHERRLKEEENTLIGRYTKGYVRAIEKAEEAKEKVVRTVKHLANSFRMGKRSYSTAASASPVTAAGFGEPQHVYSADPDQEEVAKRMRHKAEEVRLVGDQVQDSEHTHQSTLRQVETTGMQSAEKYAPFMVQPESADAGRSSGLNTSGSVKDSARPGGKAAGATSSIEGITHGSDSEEAMKKETERTHRQQSEVVEKVMQGAILRQEDVSPAGRTIRDLQTDTGK